MEKLLGALEMVLPVLFIIIIGKICGIKCVLQKQGLAGLKAFAVNICLPAVLFRAFYNANYDYSIIIIAITMFFICMLAFYVGFLIKRTLNVSRLFPFLITGFEAGMLGYTLYMLLFGADSIMQFAIVDLGQVLFVFTVYLSVLKRGESKTPYSLKLILKSMISSPVVIAILSGIVVGATNIGSLINASTAGGIINAVLDFTAAPTAAIILFVIGYDLKFPLQTIKTALTTAAARIVLIGILCTVTLILIGVLIDVTNQLKWAFIIMFILPPPFVLPVFTSNDKEASFASAVISIYTIFTLAAFAIISYISA